MDDIFTIFTALKVLKPNIDLEFIDRGEKVSSLFSTGKAWLAITGQAGMEPNLIWWNDK